MKKYITLIMLMGALIPAGAQAQTLSLDSCRAMALRNNKQLNASKRKKDVAYNMKKSARTKYLPKVDALGGYEWFSREISLLNDGQKSTFSNIGSTVTGGISGGASNLMSQLVSQGMITPEIAQQIGGLLNEKLGPLQQQGNALGEKLVDAFRTDTLNMYAGALTLTQPLYMGGKIRAYNKITRYAEELARQQHNSGMQEVILSTDQAYWQVVSLANKKKLAEGYLELLQKLESDIDKMIAEGVATKADGLSVKVKVNEAEMTLTKVNDGLSLSRMLLCQLCGLDLSTPVTLADEQEDDLLPTPADSGSIDMNSVYATRPEVRSLELAAQIYKQKVNVTRSEFLPSVALIGNYMATNPSVFNSFENKFKGMWNVGVMVSIPVWHWGEGIYKVKAAKSEARISRYQLDDAKEKIELQVSQSVFKVNEAAKKLIMAEKNLEKADENLRYATLGFEEGVIPASNVLEAHTAWLSAQSEKIDAQIDVKLTEIYLKKATGSLNIEN